MIQFLHGDLSSTRVDFLRTLASSLMLVGVQPANAVPDIGCQVERVSFSDLDQRNALACDPAAPLSLVLPDGRTAYVPQPGWTVTASGVSPAGSEAIPDVSITRGAAGSVAVLIDDAAGGTPTVFGDYALVDSVSDPYGPSQPAVMASVNPKCDNYSYNAFPTRWVTTFQWRLKSASAATISSTALAGGINAMANGTSICGNLANSATASYLGTTTSSATVYSNGLYAPTNQLNVIDLGALPSNYLAAACRYENAGLISWASVRFNSAFTWYTASSSTGCSGSKYDVQGVMTHEAGHVFGLNHVAESTLQVMKPSSGTCEVSQRSLGAGDLAGMKVKYP